MTFFNIKAACYFHISKWISWRTTQFPTALSKQTCLLVTCKKDTISWSIVNYLNVFPCIGKHKKVKYSSNFYCTWGPGSPLSPLAPDEPGPPFIKYTKYTVNLRKHKHATQTNIFYKLIKNRSTFELIIMKPVL